MGPGGAGKTRWPSRWVPSSSSSFRDGVWWVDLVEVTDPELLPSAISRAAVAPRGSDGSPRRSRAAARREAGAAHPRQLRAPRRRVRRGGGRDPAPVPRGRGPGHEPRPAERAGRAELAGAAAGAPVGRGRVSRGGREQRRGPPVRRSRHTSATRLPSHGRERGRRRGHLLPPGRDPARHRAGGGSVPGAVAGPAPRRARRLARGARRRPADRRRAPPDHRALDRVEPLAALRGDPRRVPSPGRVRVAVHPRGRPGGGGGRRDRAARGGRRARAPHRPVARADGRPRRSSRASACSRRFASSLAGRSTPRARPRRLVDRHAAYFRARALGLWPLFHDGLAALLDTADAEYGDLVAMLTYLEHHATPEEHVEVAMACLPAIGVRHVAEVVALGDAAAARVEPTSVLGGHLHLRLALADPTMPDHVQIALAAAEATDDPELGALATLLGDLGAGRPGAEPRRGGGLRACSQRPRGRRRGPLLPDPLGRRRPPPRDGPPRGGHPALAAIRRGDGVHAVQRHGLVRGDAARPRAW